MTLRTHHDQEISKSRAYVSKAVSFAEEVLCEVLWPTRCAICDTPGQVLCDRCERELTYVDVWRACPVCGAPYGFLQCDLCNEVSFGRMGRRQLPFDACASATLFDERSGQLVRVFKDGGEQRLADRMALMMSRFIPNWWEIEALTFIPATKAAYRHRGFDHAALLAQKVAVLLDVPVLEVFDRPATKDQRKFGAQQRIANLSGRFKLKTTSSFPRNIGGILVIDDVFTTGATLCEACDALASTADRIQCLTFARV